jgi:hypothetical protein
LSQFERRRSQVLRQSEEFRSDVDRQATGTLPFTPNHSVSVMLFTLDRVLQITGLYDKYSPPTNNGPCTAKKDKKTKIIVISIAVRVNVKSTCYAKALQLQNLKTEEEDERQEEGKQEAAQF